MNEKTDNDYCKKKKKDLILHFLLIWPYVIASAERFSMVFGIETIRTHTVDYLVKMLYDTK